MGDCVALRDESIACEFYSYCSVMVMINKRGSLPEVLHGVLYPEADGNGILKINK